MIAINILLLLGLVAVSVSASILEGAWPEGNQGSASEPHAADTNAASSSAVMESKLAADNHDVSMDGHDKAADGHDQAVDGHDAPLVDAVKGGVESSRVVMEGLESDRITAEIEDLQQKLGDLQNSIDKALQEESGTSTSSDRRKREASEDGEPGFSERRRHPRHPSVDAMSGQLDHLIKTIGSLQSFFGKGLVNKKEQDLNEDRDVLEGREELGDEGFREVYDHTDRDASHGNSRATSLKDPETV